MSNKLTIKQEKFCQLYIELGNASEAYRQSYDVGGSKTETINENASRLLADSKVSARVKELKKQLTEKHDVTKELIAKKYLEIINDSEETFDLAKLKDADKEEKSRFYRMAQVTSNADKLRALDALTKMYGLNEPEKIEEDIKVEINIKRDRDE